MVCSETLYLHLYIFVCSISSILQYFYLTEPNHDQIYWLKVQIYVNLNSDISSHSIFSIVSDINSEDREKKQIKHNLLNPRHIQLQTARKFLLLSLFLPLLLP